MASANMEILGQGIGEPAEFPFVITPSDTDAFSDVGLPIPRAIRVGGAGDLSVQRLDGVVVVIGSVLAGETLPIRCKKVYSTATTATEITGYA